jgi:hypothetical protein
VFGATGSGKSSFMRGCLGKPFQNTYVPTTKEFSVVNSIEVYGVEKELVVIIFFTFIYRWKSMDHNLILRFFLIRRNWRAAMYYVLSMIPTIHIHLHMSPIFE